MGHIQHGHISVYPIAIRLKSFRLVCRARDAELPLRFAVLQIYTTGYSESLSVKSDGFDIKNKESFHKLAHFFAPIASSTFATASLERIFGSGLL